MIRFSLLYSIILLFLFSCQPSGNNYSNSEKKQIPHLEKQGNAQRIVVKGKPMLLLAGELQNSTCGGEETMKPVWKRMVDKNLNTAIATVSWELIEPEEGNFDYTLVDKTISGARKEDLKLVLIWFASWKNAASTYIPSWVKADYDKYPRAKDENGKPLEILSAFGVESCKADANAFAHLMKHIKKIDSLQQTVIMVQVENEMGVLDHLGTYPGNARRDFSQAANKAYNGEVPQELIKYLTGHKGNLFPELSKVWAANGNKTSGTWEEVFGKSTLKPDIKDWKYYSYYTEELFSAWNYAKYVEKVAEAGKKEYPIPMYVNAWLKQPFSYIPGKYPSGGPLPQVIDVWRAAAPSIDFIAPDIYTNEFDWVCQEYTRSGNPLFIPETRGGKTGAARAFYVFGEYGAGCFSPFGIDGKGYDKGDAIEDAYKVLDDLSPLILENQGKETMRGLLVDSLKPVQKIKMGEYTIEAHLAGNQKDIAGGIIFQIKPDEFIVASKAMDVMFYPQDNSKRIAVNAVDEGKFKNGKWEAIRRLNGDEVHAGTWSGTGLKFPDDDYSIQKISIYSYK